MNYIFIFKFANALEIMNFEFKNELGPGTSVSKSLIEFANWQPAIHSVYRGHRVDKSSHNYLTYYFFASYPENEDTQRYARNFNEDLHSEFGIHVEAEILFGKPEDYILRFEECIYKKPAQCSPFGKVN